MKIIIRVEGSERTHRYGPSIGRAVFAAATAAMDNGKPRIVRFPRDLDGRSSVVTTARLAAVFADTEETDEPRQTEPPGTTRPGAGVAP